MFPLEKEEGLRTYMLSEERRKELEAAYGADAAAIIMERYQSKPYVLTLEIREWLAHEIDKQGTEQYKTSNAFEWHTIRPVTYSPRYFHYFLRDLYFLPSNEIYTELDKDFRGDTCDCIYLSGLLDRLDIDGYFDESRLVVWYEPCDGYSTYDVTPGSMIPGLEYGRSFRGSKEIRQKADIVRRWIADKRKQASVGEKLIPSKERIAKAKEYLRHLTLADVKTAFDSLGLNSITKSGEWGAAIVALAASGVLRASSAYEAYDWFVASGFEGTSRRAVSDQWSFTSAQEFKNRHEGRVFTAVFTEMTTAVEEASRQATIRE